MRHDRREQQHGRLQALLQDRAPLLAAVVGAPEAKTVMGAFGGSLKPTEDLPRLIDLYQTNRTLEES